MLALSKALLKCGARVDEPLKSRKVREGGYPRGYRTPLISATDHANAQQVQLLLEHNANPNGNTAADENDRIGEDGVKGSVSPLVVAARNRRRKHNGTDSTQCAQLLLAFGAVLSEKDLSIITNVEVGRSGAVNDDDADACVAAGYILQMHHSDVINSPLKIILDCRLHVLGSRMFKNGACARARVRASARACMLSTSVFFLYFLFLFLFICICTFVLFDVDVLKFKSTLLNAPRPRHLLPRVHSKHFIILHADLHTMHSPYHIPAFIKDSFI